jgi:hypothetical protein
LKIFIGIWIAEEILNTIDLNSLRRLIMKIFGVCESKIEIDWEKVRWVWGECWVVQTSINQSGVWWGLDGFKEEIEVEGGSTYEGWLFRKTRLEACWMLELLG